VGADECYNSTEKADSVEPRTISVL
jgi:hypothetical protein